MPDLDPKKLFAFYVNLDHRTDRLEHMKGELTRAGISAWRMRGMLPSEYTEDPAKVDVMMRRTPGAVGCHFCQRSIIRIGAEQGENVLVMEDDLVFCSDFQSRLEHIARFLKGRAWDIIWLGGTVHINPPVWHKDGLGRDAECTDDPRIVRTFGAFSTHAYIVNGDSCAKVVKLLDNIVHKSIGIDWAMIQMQPELQTFMYLPGCVKQMDNQSDIGNGATIFSGFAKLGSYWWQDRAEDFDPNTFNFAEARVA